ncbi:MAG: nucleoside hydrolase [Anaerolineales bacterium]
MAEQKKRLILDVDTGFDDAVAILLAGHHPALDLAAVCVVHGNAPLEVTLDNTLRVMRAGGLEHVPVYVGAARALVAEPLRTDPLQHKRFDLPPPLAKPQAQRAAEFLIDYYRGPHGLATIYAPMGPQTNLALALQLEPKLTERIPHIVTMAGAYLEGNTTPSAEFNVLADPEAAHIVVTSGFNITMVGLEACYQALITPDDMVQLHSFNTPRAALAADIMLPHVEWWLEVMQWPGGPVYDAVAVAAIADPDLLQTKAAHVDIELHGTYTRGRTVADMVGWHQQPPNVEVAVKVNRARFIEVLFEGLR